MIRVFLVEIYFKIRRCKFSTMQMPDYLPYPVLTFDLDLNEYKRGDQLKITGKAKNRSAGSSYFDVFVKIDIPIKWIPYTLVALGVAVVAIAATVVGLKIKKKKRD